jgi:phosphoribosylformylglycinamidine (FGAM) synthase-like amidotransferase family enzyme
MRIAILQFIDSNCDQEIILAIERQGMCAVIIHEMIADSLNFNGYVLLDHFDSGLFNSFLVAEASKGKPILALGEGAKTLVQLGLIPGTQPHVACIQIVDANNMAETRQLMINEDYQANAFTKQFNNQETLSCSHIQTQFNIAPGLLKQVQVQGLDIFLQKDTAVPVALANKSGNVMAFLPQTLTAASYDKLFQSVKDYLEEGFVPQVNPLCYDPRYHQM